MSTAQLVVGVVAASAMVQGLVSLALPDVQPIVVHSLDYRAGVVHQDRTVNTDAEFFPAEWRASVIDADTKMPVEGCSGRGFWNYTSGRYTAPLDLPEWVGQDGCTPEYLRTVGGEFYPVASWHWGDEYTKKTGDKFKP